MDGVDVYVGGFGGQADDSIEPVRGIDTNLILSPLGV